jgi:exodeoxyribonuclease VII large subunit
MSSVLQGRRIHEVSELASRVKSSLDEGFGQIWVRGEISNFRSYSSGHWYFTLKDFDAQLKAAMFSRDNRRLRFEPRDGDAVLVSGRVDLYVRRGDLQVVASHMEPEGAGRLAREFEQLKARLSEEGLFEPGRKRALPRVPRHIGIVTSEKAAALQDMLRVLQSRDPTLNITLAPSRVQGDGAGRQVAAALDLLNQIGQAEVILCGRGGGSIEDLWAFNEEVVARAIARSEIPVISCVGHEIDFTIADFVADLRAATPSAAAELAVPVRAELEAVLADRVQRLQGALARQLRARRQRLLELRVRLGRPERSLDGAVQRVDDARDRLARATSQQLQLRRQRLDSAGARLAVLNPQRDLLLSRRRLERAQQQLAGSMAVRLSRRRHELDASRRALYALGPLQALARGYALVSTADGVVVRGPSQVAIGDSVQVRLAQGALRCTVNEVADEVDPNLRTTNKE